MKNFHQQYFEKFSKNELNAKKKNELIKTDLIKKRILFFKNRIIITTTIIKRRSSEKSQKYSKNRD